MLDFIGLSGADKFFKFNLTKSILTYKLLTFTSTGGLKMEQKVQVVIKNPEIEESIIYPVKGSTLLEILDLLKIKSKQRYIAAKLNNQYVDLSDEVFTNVEVYFIPVNDPAGIAIYRHTAVHILSCAIERLFGYDVLNIGPSINYNLYFDLEIKEKITDELLEKIENEMREIVKEDIKIEKRIVPAREAINYYRMKNETDKVRLIETARFEQVKLYYIDKSREICDGPLAPSTGYITKFKLIKYPPGFMLVFPSIVNSKLRMSKTKHPKKLSKVFLETRDWYKDQGISTTAQLNNIVLNRKLREIINISEALHEKKISQIADIITERRKDVRLVLIAGPSSSGKTTFCKRLSIQLRVNGIKPVAISLDDYFVDRDKTPLDENGKPDFESIYALDLPLLHKHLKELLEGKEVEIPKYNFYEGKREPYGKKLRLKENEILIIEGIHGLNEKLTENIPAKNKFKIYVSALIQLRINSHHRFTTTDTRLLRRIVRDFLFRGHTALDTLRMWPSVRRGEERNIFPFQEEADIMFNSALAYEPAIIKPFAYSYLLTVPHREPEYAEAKRLLQILDYFVGAEPKYVPPSSILREFIGGSSFKY